MTRNPRPLLQAVRPFALIATGALLLRVVCLMQTAQMPFVRHLVGDAAGYYAWAREIALGSWLGEEAFYQAPLYPYVLAANLWVWGDGIWALRLVQALWGALAVVCLGCAAGRMFDRQVGLLAALMLALYAPAIFFDGIVQKASLGCLILCALLWATVWMGSSQRLLPAAVIGVLVGHLMLTRENAIVWVPILILWVWASRRNGDTRAPIQAMGLYLLGLAIVLVPVGIRNAAVCGEWSLSTFQAGPNFYIGNSAKADGRYRPLVRGHETPAFERRDAAELAEEALGHKLTPRQVSRYWMSRGLEDIRADPTRWLRLCALKMLMVWNHYEVSDVENLYLYTEYSALLGVLGCVWHFGVLCPLAAVGVALTGRQWRQLWVYYVLIASMACSVALFYVMARYRFPLVPLLIPFASAGCVYTWRRLRVAEYRRLLAPTVIAVLVAAIVNVPVHDERRLDAMAQMNLGVALAEEGELEQAAGHFQRALNDHPNSAEAHNNLAQALALQGDYAAAVPHYETALAIEPGLTGVNYNLAVALEHLGRSAEALGQYLRAGELDAADIQARRAVERLRGQQR